MIRRNTRRPAFLAIVIAALVCVIGVAFADTYEPTLPGFPDPHFTDPQLLVTPSDNLLNGQQVSVTGRRFGADASGGTLRECTADLTLCEAPRGTFTTGSNGEFNPVGAPFVPSDPETIPVNFTVVAGFIATNGTPVNCLLTPCVILASISDGGETRSAAHHITFLGGVTTTSTSSTSSTSTSSTSTTSTSSTSSTSTSSTSTSSTTSTTVAPTSTSSTSTSTSTSTSSTSTSTSTSTTKPQVTTTSPATLSACDQLRLRRAQINTELDAAKAANPSQTVQIEAYRAAVNARIDQELAARGCATGA